MVTLASRNFQSPKKDRGLPHLFRSRWHLLLWFFFSFPMPNPRCHQPFTITSLNSNPLLPLNVLNPTSWWNSYGCGFWGFWASCPYSCRHSWHWNTLVRPHWSPWDSRVTCENQGGGEEMFSAAWLSSHDRGLLQIRIRQLLLAALLLLFLAMLLSDRFRTP